MPETDSFLRFFFGCKKRFKRFSLESINRYQLTKGREVVNYAVKHAPFFRNYFAKSNLKDVWHLPKVNKKMMMEHLSDYNTLAFKKDELLSFVERIEREKNYSERFRGHNVALSSGTSGNKGIVITSPKEEKYLQAAFFARFNFPFIFRIKWAFILRVTTPAFQVSKFGQKLTHISLQLPLQELRDRLQKFQPNILSAPPSMLQIIAQELSNGRLDIQPKRVVSYAEVLDPQTEHELEEVFDTTIHQIYQGSEGAIAMTCKKGSLHINEDLVKLQLYNKDGSKTAPGETCIQSVVTDLHKKSQPIIRFELNDLIRLAEEKCSCGSSFRVIDQIFGRADDLFWGVDKANGEWNYIFPDYIRRAIITTSESIIDYQAIQQSPTKIIVRLVLAEQYDSSVFDKIIKHITEVFNSHNCLQPEIRIKREKPVIHPESLKLIRVVRDFTIN